MRETKATSGRRRLRFAVRFSVVLAVPLLLGGCAGLPLGVQIASYVADGVLFLTTKKSLTDHTLSMITQKDCSIWRGVSKGELCTEPTLDEIEVVVERAPAMDGAEVEIASAYPVADVEAGALPSIMPAPIVPGQIAPRLVPASYAMAAPDSDIETAGEADEPIQNAPPETAPLRGRTFLVVGSFRKLVHARHLFAQLRDMPVFVLPGVVNGRRYHRIAVGPLAPGTAPEWRARLADIGITESWAVKFYDTNQTAQSLDAPALDFAAADVSAPGIAATEVAARVDAAATVVAQLGTVQ